MSINYEINRLLNFAVQQELMNAEDFYYSANRLVDVLKLADFEPEEVKEELASPAPILKEMLDYAVSEGLIEDTVNERDLFDTRIMDCVMPRPSEVIRRFRSDYARSPKAATDRFYKLSQASNYIRTDRIAKNLQWKTPTEYGDLDITINLSKPEKIYVDNTNLMAALVPHVNIGVERETYFYSQVRKDHAVAYTGTGDFVVDGKWTFEVGGKGKGFSQIADMPYSYVVNDETTIGHGNKIPLWLFGFLY